MGGGITMSYEGYTQALCVKGHQNSIDQYEERETCHVCQEALVWFHQVDLTNGCMCSDTDNRTGYECPAHRMKLEELKPADYKTCPTCHREEMVSPPTYKIPENI
jgi:hypothetical protein